MIANEMNIEFKITRDEHGRTDIYTKIPSNYKYNGMILRRTWLPPPIAKGGNNFVSESVINIDEFLRDFGVELKFALGVSFQGVDRLPNKYKKRIDDIT